ncbi:cobalt-precorrin 5A hydrolase [Alteribacillus iranensis]|uniref:Cobalt-precorrin 5A acetaldehyde-lyase n=1 Tax=Alteribacillus iranensis TaxID=930128 RepID=A0A1I2B5D0_9BACI|nr:cobalamin biosynthesis protein [Alteribacillus iranensis]SFE51385.1 cobalt-precorrin 5A acetaldehyde-lyase [Alteribacillus iranensis]
MNNIAAVAITKHGVSLVRRLAKALPGTDIFYMKKFEQGDEEKKGFTLFEGSVRKQLPSYFEKYDGIIMIISLGAVVRMISPLLKDKKTDPAVVVIDDRGEFVISVLSGHLGGANGLTKTVASQLDATPVITTASDVQETIPVDIFGRAFGWVPEDFEQVIPASAAVVNEEPLVIVQESGEKDWWTYDKDLPGHMTVVSSPEEAKELDVKAALVITHRNLTATDKESLPEVRMIYRPKVVHIGIGCNRGTEADEIEAVIESTLQRLQINRLSVKQVATIDLKKDEEGLLKVCEKNSWPFVYYSPDELNQAPIQNPSDVVYKYTGAYGVSEPAAVLSSGNERLLLEKEKSGNVTISIAIQESFGTRGSEHEI